MGFHSLQHSRVRRSTVRGLCLPATFRPQGLATLSAVCSLRAPAGSVSRRRRSWDSPFGASSSRKVSAAFPRGRAHLPFLLPVIPPLKRWAGPAGRGFWALPLPEVPGGRTQDWCAARWLLPWVSPFQGSPAKAWSGISPRLLPRALAGPEPRGLGTPAPRSLNRPSPGPVHATRKAGLDGRNDPLRVLAPGCSRPFEPAAVRAMCSPRAAPRIAADCRRSLDSGPGSAGAARENPVVPSVRDLNVACANIAALSVAAKENTRFAPLTRCHNLLAHVR